MISVKFFVDVNMSMDSQATKCRRNIAENFNRSLAGRRSASELLASELLANRIVCDRRNSIALSIALASWIVRDRPITLSSSLAARLQLASR